MGWCISKDCSSHLYNSGQEVMQCQGRGLGAVLESRAAPSHSCQQDQPDLYSGVAFPLNRWQTHSFPFASKFHFLSKQLFAVSMFCLLLLCGFLFVCNFVVLMGFFKDKCHSLLGPILSTRHSGRFSTPNYNGLLHPIASLCGNS